MPEVLPPPLEEDMHSFSRRRKQSRWDRISNSHCKITIRSAIAELRYRGWIRKWEAGSRVNSKVPRNLDPAVVAAIVACCRSCIQPESLASTSLPPAGPRLTSTDRHPTPSSGATTWKSGQDNRAEASNKPTEGDPGNSIGAGAGVPHQTATFRKFQTSNPIVPGEPASILRCPRRLPA
ncbi:hypothetical protein VTI74DRAFT_3200 [Chaetomium olivicolor]